MTFLVLAFDKTLEVVHSTFSIDGETFVTRLGGSVSSGRTLLWIFVSLFGAAQVILAEIFLPIFPGDLEIEKHKCHFWIAGFHLITNQGVDNRENTNWQLAHFKSSFNACSAFLRPCFRRRDFTFIQTFCDYF